MLPQPAPIWRRAPRPAGRTSTRCRWLQPLRVPQVPTAPNCRRMDEVQAQMEQMSDRARERAVSIAEAVRAAGEGDAGLMTRLQHQQDDQLQVRLTLCGSAVASECMGWSEDGAVAPGSHPLAVAAACARQVGSMHAQPGRNDQLAYTGPAPPAGGRKHVGADPGHLHPGEHQPCPAACRRLLHSSRVIGHPLLRVACSMLLPRELPNASQS